MGFPDLPNSFGIGASLIVTVIFFIFVWKRQTIQETTSLYLSNRQVQRMQWSIWLLLATTLFLLVLAGSVVSNYTSSEGLSLGDIITFVGLILSVITLFGSFQLLREATRVNTKIRKSRGIRG